MKREQFETVGGGWSTSLRKHLLTRAQVDLSTRPPSSEAKACFGKVARNAHVSNTTPPKWVRTVIPSAATGFYRLGVIEDGEFRPRYFGRSDRELRSRLLTHRRERPEMTHFAPMVTSTIRRAFELECREWHLRGESMENEIHPASPRHIAYDCPYCGLEQRLATV